MPRRTRFEDVRKRLLWAKKIHQQKGILGQSSEPSTMRQLIEFYRSNQWQSRAGLDGLPVDLLRVVNKIFPIANRQQAGVAARNPRVEYFPKRQDARRATAVAESLHNHDIREQAHIRAFNAALRFHQFAPFPGIVRHGYTPEAELRDDDGRPIGKLRRAHPDRPWIEAAAPWDVLIDPSVDSFEEGAPRWCAFRSVWFLDHIRRHPKMIAREKLKGLRGRLSPAWQDLVNEERLPREDPDRHRYVEIWSVYEADTEEWMQLTLDGLDEWIRPPEPWPIPWEGLPLDTFQVNRQIDDPYPLALLEDMIPYQQELNVVRTMMSVFVRNLRRPPVINRQRLEEGEDAKIERSDLVEAIWATGDPREIIASQQLGGLPQELLIYAAQIIDDMRESAGYSDFDRAQRANVESATEATLIQGGSTILEARVQEAFESFITAAERKYMQGRRWILQETGGNEHVRILGDSPARELEEFLDVDAETLQGEYDFEIVAGSTRAKNLREEAQAAAVDIGITKEFPFVRQSEMVGRYLDARRIDRSRAMEQAAPLADAQQRAAAQRRSQGIEEGNGAAQPLDANLVNVLSGGGSA